MWCKPSGFKSRVPHRTECGVGKGGFPRTRLSSFLTFNADKPAESSGKTNPKAARLQRAAGARAVFIRRNALAARSLCGILPAGNGLLYAAMAGASPGTVGESLPAGREIGTRQFSSIGITGDDSSPRRSSGDGEAIARSATIGQYRFNSGLGNDTRSGQLGHHHPHSRCRRRVGFVAQC